MWSLYDKDKFLEPLRFSNGKTQEDVVREILKSIKEGNKVIFIHGVCGTGKSAIALHLAKELGKTSIVVPTKNLQEQYRKDYENEKYILKDNREKLKIKVITGRKNHKCRFTEENINLIPKFKKEINSSLHDIFEGRSEEAKRQKEKDNSADNDDLPCKIEIKEKNIRKIKEYLRQNKKVSQKNFQEIKDVKRFSIAPVCPYWSPVIPEEYELKILDNADKKCYLGVNRKRFAFYQRKPGCGFYEQFNSYIEADAIVFNSLKYKLESLLGRKPATEAEIIDECDEFLDSFSNQKTINIDRLQNALLYAIADKDADRAIDEMQEILMHMTKNPIVGEAIANESIVPIKQTGIYDLFQILLKNREILNELDDENYLFDVEETARMFERFLDDSFVIFSRREKNLLAGVVTTNLSGRFQEIIDNNKVIVLMSGTLHNKEVLDKIFGIKEYKIIEAETEPPGKIEIIRTGLEMNCKYQNFSSDKNRRAEYLKALDKCIETAKKPVLVHVNAFNDLPSREEIRQFEIKNTISREELGEMQEKNKSGKFVDDFKMGKIDTLFSTKATRGMDFPGEQCNSIIFTKYPNPNIRDAFWRILEKTRPQHYWYFYKDKARRELFQKVYRGLRFKEDHVYVLSPDERVLEAVEG